MKRLSIALSLLLIVTLSVGCSSNPTPDASSGNTTTNEYIDIEPSNELKLYASPHEPIPLSVDASFYQTFTDYLLSEDYGFRYSDAYGLDAALSLYQATNTQKKLTSSLLDKDEHLDAKKLLSTIETNNQKLMSGGKNALNSFYTETSKADKTKICQMIADVINNTCNVTERKQLGNTLSAMTMFNRTGSPSNAYITNHLTFVYNPSMSNMYADTQALTTDDDKDSILNSVIVHEIMHLIQHKNDDLIDENGIEVGMCRTYNLENSEKKIPVDSLWNSWILEASAELQMADYLGIDTHTYAKKISYAASYNLSRFCELSDKSDRLEYVAFRETLEDIYAKLNLSSSKEQLDFLKFMYSVEILQYDPEDFWQNYTSVTGYSPTDEEKLSIRLTIREEVVRYLSVNFYLNIANAIVEKKITDFDTLFYFMRIWELDCYNHLEYTKVSAIESAKPFIEWHDKIQSFFFQTLETTSNQDITSLYHAYYLQLQFGNTITDNCSLEAFDLSIKDYIGNLKSSYRIAYFAKTKDMMQYFTSRN